VSWPEFAETAPHSAPTSQPPGLRKAGGRSGRLAGAWHGACRGVAAAQCRVPGGICRLLVDPGLAPQSRGERAPPFCLGSPPSASTKPGASAVDGCGLKVGAGGLRSDGNIDAATWEAKARSTPPSLAAVNGHLSLTHGVFETGIRPNSARWCTSYGGQVYLDGANLKCPVGSPHRASFRRRVCPPQPATDLLHSPRRRWSGVGPIGVSAPSGALSFRPSPTPRCRFRA